MITVYSEALVDLVPTSADPLAPLQPALGASVHLSNCPTGNEPTPWVPTAPPPTPSTSTAALTVSRTGAETPRLEEVHAFQRGE